MNSTTTNTMTDNTKYLFPTDDYMTDYTVVPPPYATKVELSGAPVLYQEGSFHYMNTSPVSMGEATPSTTTTDASTVSMIEHDNNFHNHNCQQQQLLPEVSVAPYQQMTPRPQQQEETTSIGGVSIGGGGGAYSMQQHSPGTPMSTLTSCCTSPAPAPLMNVTSMTNTHPIGLGLLPCTPTSPSSSSPSPPSSASVSSSLVPCPINNNEKNTTRQPMTADHFYPEFLHYSKECYDHPQQQQQPVPSMSPSSGQKKRSNQQKSTVTSMSCGNSDAVTPNTPTGMIDDAAENNNQQSHPHHHHHDTTPASSVEEWTDHIKTETTALTNPQQQQQQQQQQQSLISNSELRRQIHIQSEQKRRAQIKDGFEDLRNELPSCLNKKMSKVALLHRTVQHIQHLKSTQVTILAELERLVNENEQLRKFQESVLQKQALEKMCHMNDNPQHSL
ncbi:hypothetical protein BDA99DRAFT_529766 [Phascolomyces articulosus]|uniref:BHLH domain-containing protein n=1 Tax=Phascolomyces articulosus TaxID=60185 RepID=A0AAD5JLG5_9FUNG|nr:hypothetical protein BDA99DRAFT_529766 [Phascolomyces articulosus]